MEGRSSPQYCFPLVHGNRAVGVSAECQEGSYDLDAVYGHYCDCRRGDRVEAQKNYRAALSLDPSYEPCDQESSAIDRAETKGSHRPGRRHPGSEKKIPPKEDSETNTNVFLFVPIGLGLIPDLAFMLPAEVTAVT